ncbi:MAG: hypothetical protein HZA07_04875 [Nitrospirae bacterium]|nr:hypothetical protein [Nitrospirota bacterium]
MSDLPSEFIGYVFLTNEAVTLADTYISHDVVTEKHLIDAQHIAIATIERVDVLVIENCIRNVRPLVIPAKAGIQA